LLSSPSPPPAPAELDAVLKEIENAISAKLYYLAIAVALSVPDICSGLESDPDNPIWQDRKTYTQWCNRNIGELNHLTGDDLYNLRGGVLHKGHFGHDKSRFKRVFFLSPESNLSSKGSVINGQFRLGPQQALWSGPILLFDVVAFCGIIIAAARQWAVVKKDDPFEQKNLSKLVYYRPNAGCHHFQSECPPLADFLRQVDAAHVPRDVANDLLEICPMLHYPADFSAEVCWQNILRLRNYFGNSFHHGYAPR
jgi:hypothetical protein